jgi:hypothetical protein
MSGGPLVQVRKCIKQNISNVPKLLGLKLLDLLTTWKHILVIKIDAGSLVVTGWFEIKRETTKLDIIEWYEGCHCSVIKIVLGCLMLFPHMECNIEVMPYYQECLLADKSNNLEKLLLAEIFDFADCHCVR